MGNQVLIKIKSQIIGITYGYDWLGMVKTGMLKALLHLFWGVKSPLVKNWSKIVENCPKIAKNLQQFTTFEGFGGPKVFQMTISGYIGL